MKIIADTPTLYSPEEGRELGLIIIPACTIIEGKSYRDYEDISCEEFLNKIKSGLIATTSQPAIGDILDVYEKNDEELLVLPIGDGLSGTYQNMVGAKNLIDNNEHIHVIDTKTLAGAQRYLVQKAKKLFEEGKDIYKIKCELQESIDTSVSFVIPTDFDFLKRSGRLTPLAAKLSAAIKIVPVMTQTKDKKRITLFVIKRSKRKAVDSIINHLKDLGVNESYIISVSHGGVEEEAKSVLRQIQEEFPQTDIELFSLIPSLVTHGGPGCIVIQAIRK